jgi:HD domain
MELTRRYDDALLYASNLHREQKRKGTEIPYMSHLIAVSSLVMEHGGDEDPAIAGLLDDAAEDQGGEATLAEIRRRFGDAVADIVADCTDSWIDPKPEWRVRKEQYLAKLPQKPAASCWFHSRTRRTTREQFFSTTETSASRSGIDSLAARTGPCGTTNRWRQYSRPGCRARWLMS